ncbi:MAG: Unknown protein [uncultured Sulfurovum sp.]|uniref:Uncharacterized protein n=1 Tax=uncultured Sulfurovum sp. TaxID=269237 RepID=A0A6S6SHG9_9BACT|nr:MAG: Unknown protein [uncultured Sulfurovum sp.]
MRITITEKQASVLQAILENSMNSDIENEKTVAYTLLKQIINEKHKHSSEKQKHAAKKATKTRTAKAKNKIENAVNLLRLEKKEITTYSVSLASGCSFNTCKKYKHYWEN